MLWTAGNKQDANLISSNIKDWVTIFGVEGSFEGLTSGWLGNFMWGYCVRWPDNSYKTTNIRAIELWDFIYLFCWGWAWWNWASMLTSWLFTKINKTNWEVVLTWKTWNFWGSSSSSDAAPSLLSSYIDWWIIYINYSVVWWWTWNFHYKIDTTTDIITFETWHYTTGVLFSTTDVTIWWVKYTPISSFLDRIPYDTTDDQTWRVAYYTAETI